MKTFLITLTLSIFSLGIKAQNFQQTAGMGNAGPVEGVFAHENIVLASVADRLYRSDDYGDTFSYISVAGEDVTPRCFAMIDDVIILGGINGDRIYRSTNLGINWESSWTGGPDIFGFSSAVPYTADTLNGEFYMCGTNFIRKSSDLGMSWETMDIDGLCLDISSTEGELWATPGGNLHQSLDQGETWQDVPDDGIFFSNASKDVLVSEGRILVATSLSAGNGLYISDDEGISYSVSGNITIGNSFLKLNDTIYFTHLGGFSKSTDNGDSWTIIEGLGGFSTYNGDMSFDGDKIWLASTVGLFWYDINTEEIGSYPFPVGMVEQVSLGSNFSYGLQNNELFQSPDNGSAWQNITTNLSTEFIDVTDVYADGQDIYVLAIVNSSLTYFYSSNEGTTFESIPLVDSMSGANQILSFNPVVIAADNGVFVSNDNGMNFNQADLMNLDGTDAQDDYIALDINQSESSIFIRGVQGLAYSHDTGVNWTYLDATSVVQFAGWEGRLIRNKSNSFPPFETQESTDGGATWENLAGLETQFTGPEFMWMMNDTMFIQNDQNAPSPGQIYFLAENSSEWIEASWYGAIPDQIISAESTSEGHIILGTRNAGAWILSTDIADFIVDAEKKTLKVYPNPTTDLLFLEGLYDVKSELSIYNSMGQKVFFSNKTSNFIDTSFLEKGIYYLTTNNHKLPFIKR